MVTPLCHTLARQQDHTGWAACTRHWLAVWLLMQLL